MTETEKTPDKVAEKSTSKSTKKSAKERAEELMQETRQGKLMAELYGEALDKQYLLSGKPMHEWRRQFRVKIPESPNPSQVKAIAAKLASLFHEAQFYYSLAEAQLDALGAGDFRQYTQAYNQAIAEFKAANPKRALPSAETLKNQANSEVMDIKSAISNIRIAKNFWKRMLEGLTEVRKNLEIISKNLYFELQIESRGTPNVPSTPSRGGFGNKS